MNELVISLFFFSFLLLFHSTIMTRCYYKAFLLHTSSYNLLFLFEQVIESLRDLNQGEAAY